MDSTEAKLLSLFLLLGLSVLIGCFPLCFRRLFRRKRVRTVLDYSSCLAGGIFLGTGFMHLLPEIGEKFEEYYESRDIQPDYPFMYLCLGAGFLAVFVLEQGIVSCRMKRSGAGMEFGHDHAHPVREKGSECSHSAERTSGREGAEYDNVKYHKNGGNESVQVGIPANTSQAELTLHSEKAPPEKDEDDEDDEGNPTFIDPTFKDFLLFTVMYLHAIFEGLALGLLDEVADILGLLLAVTIHKSVIVATLVVQLVTKNVKTFKSLLLLLIFTIMAPIGIVIGIIMEKTGSHETEGGILATGIMSAFATGTLFFVVFMEIIPDGFRSGKSPFSRALVVVLGFTIIALLSLIPEHHGHGHGHGACEVQNITLKDVANLTLGNVTDHDHDHDHDH